MFFSHLELLLDGLLPQLHLCEPLLLRVDVSVLLCSLVERVPRDNQDNQDIKDNQDNQDNQDPPLSRGTRTLR